MVVERDSSSSALTDCHIARMERTSLLSSRDSLAEETACLLACMSVPMFVKY